MRRGQVLIILAALLVLGGVACFAHNWHEVSRLAQASTTATGGAVRLLLVAHVGHLRPSPSFSAARAAGTSGSSEIASRGKLEYIDATDRNLMPIASGINELVDFADRAVTDAAIKLKERRFSQGSDRAAAPRAGDPLRISDAVLVLHRTLSTSWSWPTSRPRARSTLICRSLASRRSSRSSRRADGHADPRDAPERSTRWRRIIEHSIAGRNASRALKITLSCVQDQNTTRPRRRRAARHDQRRKSPR